MAKHSRFDDQLRKAIDASELSRYAIANATNIDHGNFSRFMSGNGGLSIEGIIAICDLLGLKLVEPEPKTKKPTKTKRKK